MSNWFDAIDAIGGEVLESGQRIRMAAIHYPVTRKWLADEYQHLKRLLPIIRKASQRPREPNR